jgi:hypothetical protein
VLTAPDAGWESSLRGTQPIRKVAVSRLVTPSASWSTYVAAAAQNTAKAMSTSVHTSTTTGSIPGRDFVARFIESHSPGGPDGWLPFPHTLSRSA